MGIKDASSNGLDTLLGAVDGIAQGMRWYRRDHENLINGLTIGVLGTISIGAETAALQLADRQHTLANTVGRVGLHMLATGAAIAAYNTIHD